MIDRQHEHEGHRLLGVDSAAKAAGATKKAKPKPIAAWTDIPIRTAPTTRTSSPLTGPRISAVALIP